MNRLAALLSLVLVAGAFAPAPAALADDFAYGPDTCRTGYVWREAQPFDRVCVLPSSRTRAAQENLVALGRIDEAFAWLERAWQEHDALLWMLNVDPDLAPLRTDARFQALLKKLRLVL